MAAIACHKNAPRDGVYNLKLTSAQAGNVRQQLPFLPEHPHLNYATDVHNSSNLWYCNFSNPNHCRITGMPRFACLWVGQGKTAAFTVRRRGS